MKAKVYIKHRQEILDPQGKAVLQGLNNLGFKGLTDVRVGKYIEITLDCASVESAHEQVKDMCERLLVNTVIENYTYVIEP
ncbi:MAG: phosphoribosylformylglycinamidine synthase subunit PurS [Nitrospirae bacterium]|nr:phosphoribosylformylglycinamidine synthase subunit PurS [Nitrospirota bacterium]